LATRGSTIKTDQLAEEIYDLFRSSTADVLTLYQIRDRMLEKKQIIAEDSEIVECCAALCKEGKIILASHRIRLFTEFAFMFNFQD
jgi:hypothetical protein